MCGIAGVMRHDGAPVDPSLLARMTGVLAHRGPDGDGFHLDGPVGLGHRRLAIIDLAAGAQPMASDGGSIWITYNGEIYNFVQLRLELESRGVRFRTSSDTEVILKAYETWGVECLRRLRGMFAFALWDARTRTLLIARDRVGIKPVVYAWDGQALRFGSEIKALLQDPAIPRDLDWDALHDYWLHHYIPGPRTIFRAIQKLPPASYLLCSPGGGAPTIRRYWDLSLAPDPGPTEAEWVERLTGLLDESVRLHLVSDVPLGAFLSGGLDSSAVVASMARMATGRVRTFSIGFGEADFDELAYARLVARRYGTEHVEMLVKPDVVEVLPRLAWQFDEPFGDASAVPTYCVSRITRDHVTVALSGDGGDENFAGYTRYAQALRLHQRMDRGPLALTRPALRALGALLPAGARGRRFAALLGSPSVDRYHRLMTYQDDASLHALLTSEARRQARSSGDRDAFRALAAAAGTADYVSTLQHIDIHHYLPDDILTKVDRTSMLTSLEARVPLLDHVLMEHVAAIPRSFKLQGGAGKYLLKRAMADRLPAEILTRRKMGFGVPLAAWFRAELRDFSRDVLLDSTTRNRGILRPRGVEDLLASHLRGHRDHSAVLWAAICFELWCRTWWRRP